MGLEISGVYSRGSSFCNPSSAPRRLCCLLPSQALPFTAGSQLYRARRAAVASCFHSWHRAASYCVSVLGWTVGPELLPAFLSKLSPSRGEDQLCYDTARLGLPEEPYPAPSEKLAAEATQLPNPYPRQLIYSCLLDLWVFRLRCRHTLVSDRQYGPRPWLEDSLSLLAVHFWDRIKLRHGATLEFCCFGDSQGYGQPCWKVLFHGDRNRCLSASSSPVLGWEYFRASQVTHDSSELSEMQACRRL